MKRNLRVMLAVTVLLSGLLVAPPARAQGGRSAGAPAEKQKKLIELLRSEAPKPEKALACKQLAVFGSGEAVPALAALLSDRELAAWARIPLEAIPDPAADDALRDALGKLQGRLLVGVINSIGVRRDAKAIDPLVEKLKDSDALVASSAAAALGRIGGDRAATALEQSLRAPTAEVRSAVAEGCVLCAERFLADGNAAKAIQLYDAVRRADVPKQRILEATRGAILARRADGIPLLVEQLRSQDKAVFGIALRTARELIAGDVTGALVAEFERSTPDRQSLLLVALADRGDAKVLPVVLGALASGAPSVRVTAATVLERLGDASSVPPLVEAAASDDAELAAAAKTSIARLPGKDVDASVFSRLQQSTGKMRQVLIELAEQRRIEGALPVFLKSAEDDDPAVRTAALVAIGAIGEDEQMPQLVELLKKSRDPQHRDAIERAIMSISGRWGAASVPHLLPLAREGNPAARIVALRALAGGGGPDALDAVKAATDDKDEKVKDEAVRTLSTWPNRWPEDAAATEPLLELAKSSDKPAHRVLALRGYLQFIQGSRKMGNDQKLAKVNAVLPLTTRPEEKRSAISALGSIGSAAALQPLLAFTEDASVADEACSAIVALAGKADQNIPKESRRQALQAVIEKTKSEAIRKRAQDALGKLGN